MNKKKFKLITFNKKQKANFAYKKKIIITDLLLNIIIGYHSFEKINKFLAIHQQKREDARSQLDEFLFKD